MHATCENLIAPLHKKRALSTDRLCPFLACSDCAATAASPLVCSSPSCIHQTEFLSLEWATSERQNTGARLEENEESLAVSSSEVGIAHIIRQKSRTVFSLAGLNYYSWSTLAICILSAICTFAVMSAVSIEITRTSSASGNLS